MGGPNIVVVGSSNTDMIIKLKRLPRVGETLLGGDFMTAAGGKGANQAVAAARAGGTVSFVACLGRDSLGDQALAGFIKDGIDIRHIVRDSQASSGAALILVGQDGRNVIAVAGGANTRLSPAHVRRARSAIAHAQVLLMQLETPLMTIQAAAGLAVSSGTRVILNPAPARPLPDRLLRSVSILTPNESEAEALTGVRITRPADAKKAAEKLLRRGVETVIVTMGARGALLAHEGTIELIRGFKVRAIDTTAAGDIFNGALAVALTKGHALYHAVRFANAAAALSVTRMGAQPSAPAAGVIENLLKSSV